MRRGIRRFAVLLVVVPLILAGILWLVSMGRRHPQDLPWTQLDLAQPVGAFTGRKLVALREEPRQCRALLRRAGVRFNPLPPRGSEQCGYSDGVRFTRGGALEIGYAPRDLGTSCPVAAALALWEWHVVQPAALQHFGQGVRSIDHYGSYSCRRIYGRSEGAWSEHSTANAIDIAGFRLDDGTRITVLGDWNDEGARSAFLREVRDGACDLFATVLSPDYNAAHRDHLHFDQAARGAMGWRGCR